MTADRQGYSHPFSWPIAEFARSIGAKSLAMLVAYLDDSGTHREAPVCLLAGFVANSVLIDRFERQWKDELGTREGLSWFHAVDCEEGEGEFQHMPRPLREALAFGLSNVIGDHASRMQFICAAVKRRDWEQSAPQFLKQRCSDPYYFVIEHCLQQISEWSVKAGQGEPVALVVARQQEHDEETTRIHETYLHKATYQLPGIGSLTFADPRLVVPLQAADLFAYEMYRYAGMYDGPDTVRRPILANFYRRNVAMYSAMHDAVSLRTIAKPAKTSSVPSSG